LTARDVRLQAAVVDSGRLLLLRCVPHGEAGFWVLPGGGREDGESDEECVAREVREEAGITVAVDRMLCDVPADPPDGTYPRWRTYLCRVTSGEAAPGSGENGAELTAVRWLPLDDPAAWEPELRADPFLHPQLVRIRDALRGPDVRTRVARWVSILAHPFVTTMVLAGAVEHGRGGGAGLRAAAAVGALFVLPLAVLTAVQVRRGAWTTVDASHPRDRPVLFGVGGAALAVLLAYFAHAQPGSPLVRGTAGVLAMLGVCAALTPWIKVSLHMAAAALAAGVLVGRGLPLGWGMAAILPLLAWSRVALGRHRWSEVALGLAVGACTGLGLVLLG
jgi:8-oxo-dGTP pyrophosphatase MutT (NUDIX family)/membrane-associated phospholipid phosphatase